MSFHKPSLTCGILLLLILHCFVSTLGVAAPMYQEAESASNDNVPTSTANSNGHSNFYRVIVCDFQVSIELSAGLLDTVGKLILSMAQQDPDNLDEATQKSDYDIERREMDDRLGKITNSIYGIIPTVSFADYLENISNERKLVLRSLKSIDMNEMPMRAIIHVYGVMVLQNKKLAALLDYIPTDKDQNDAEASSLQAMTKSLQQNTEFAIKSLDYQSDRSMWQGTLDLAKMLLKQTTFLYAPTTRSSSADDSTSEQQDMSLMDPLLPEDYILNERCSMVRLMDLRFELPSNLS